MRLYALFLSFFAFSTTQAQQSIPLVWQNVEPDLRIDIFRCYITDVTLHYTDGTRQAFDDFVHLIDLEDAASLQLHFPEAQAAPLRSIHFRVGTDSLLNVSGVYEGALDPLKGMYWAWNTGYINLKIEGTFQKRVLEYHVGGYRSPFATDRIVEIDFTGQTPQLVLSANAFVQKALARNLDAVMIPGKEAAALADLYPLLFSAP